jgi:hypothetical protein
MTPKIRMDWNSFLNIDRIARNKDAIEIPTLNIPSS